MSTDLEKQIEFIIEIDKMKNVFRRTYICDGSRNENDAEHSWHLAMMAIILKDYFDKDIDLLHVIKMVLIHDLVEIYAGDTYLYDEAGNSDKDKREQEAADKLFAMLPLNQCNEFMNLWHEFEAKESKESKFAGVLDRLQPLLLNYTNEGNTWNQNNINSEQLIKKQQIILEGPQEIATFFKNLVDDAIAKGYLATKS